MDKTELRVGNWVKCAKTDPKIFQLDDSDLADILRGEEYAPRNPIKLTDDWLMDFGFTKMLHGCFRNDHFEICFYIDSNNYYLEKINHHVIMRILIKSVHQLQNLYFYLTGEELKNITYGKE